MKKVVLRRFMRSEMRGLRGSGRQTGRAKAVAEVGSTSDDVASSRDRSAILIDRAPLRLDEESKRPAHLSAASHPENLLIRFYFL